MQFYDKVKITVVSWKWGDGCVSWRREAGVPYGWPSGWNGWRWWTVILEASKDVNTLLAFKYKKKFKAPMWEQGRSKEQYWANAENLILKVPVGTLITEVSSWHLLHYFSEDKDKFAVVHGGEGWLGNLEFKSPTLQYPTFAILGEPGSAIEIELELQLMWDVALIGSPSVGKSTIINALANTKAKVADYHFTTLVPHLGSVSINDFSFNLVDIPWLIKGASEWKGLGNNFLRHVLKAKIFCIVMDLYNFDKWIQEWIDLLWELLKFIKNKAHGDKDISFKIDNKWEYVILNVYAHKELLMQKQITFVFNKFDLIQDKELMQEYISSFLKQLKLCVINKNKLFKDIDEKIVQKNIFIISAATHYNLDKIVRYWADHLENRTLFNYVPELKKREEFAIYEDENSCLLTDITEQEKEQLLEEWYMEESEIQYAKVRYRDNREVSKLVYTTQRWNDEAEMRFRSMIDQKWYLELIQKSWARKWDVFKVKSYYSGQEDRYIQW